MNSPRAYLSTQKKLGARTAASVRLSEEHEKKEDLLVFAIAKGYVKGTELDENTKPCYGHVSRGQ